MIPRNEKDETYEYIKQLTLELVKTPSLVRTETENDGAKKIHEIISQLPYFVEHPENLMLVPLEQDSLMRNCVFAYVQGSSTKSNTVILLSHYDTVDIDGYGELADFAFDPLVLKKKMKHIKFNRDVENDLNSEDWLFGRGVVDMKSGIAQNIWALKQFSTDPDALNGNILFISTPDEEAMGQGSLAAAMRLIQFKAEKDLDFVGLINTDYTAPLYPGDPDHYIYAGSIGKYLLSFFVCGLDSHAGECLEGLDANLVTSHLVTRISMNCDFCDEAEGQISPPPVTLKQKDLKDVYNVLIPYEAVTYFNFFTFVKSPAEILAIAKIEAEKVMKEISEHIHRQRQFFSDRSNIPFTEKKLNARVYTYDEFYRKTVIDKPDLKQALEKLEKEYLLDEADETKLSLELTKVLVEGSDEFFENIPVIIVYLSPPFVPRVHVKNETESEKKFHHALQQAVKNSNCNIQIKPFFPYISDMSWYGMTDKPEDIKCIKANTPGFSRTCGVDLESISSLNIPTVNIGSHGKDAHKATERLHMPYSFATVPKLLHDTITLLLT
ncbi:MAG: M20/M25/M40 family metallo-hydrolase [Calditrichaeota bacterium]|jgi:arginine utilization protein RocB|nr:M20/M25/M40 family metallo-hydrolase [Deltaproteobacteria bacterium]MBT4842955.1 M20/M25/M40 family metallo-hydrolase [Anaerolineae bacterium]MBT7618782.1 M20/M25/M40 family metallo-hydrolase [Calditrichota bacterium]MBT4265087.1 M20/M25/M40 family metallo-hydrolase [Deltaproteobacteria bacterium]MBT4638280.1 M20/M25/M40 family metallo-hydrolase [Deltaproteobacteria bacterium]